ncbi:hypothetical protein KDL01_00775 [Actinospica durhamensis]|uniref:Carbamoyltransferase n=1 Tax=Actinospica durhamensis TaxID=1508375 RepID=A0A941EFN5_9ACTN|nr:carbamoyltransferase C-terminal domain-containing protein [Actinospica durhamensis]MBR7831770.1 hypothetical protein [Actinospica durhamensis]
MLVLGVSGGLSHDPAAALVLDGVLVAAAEEERFIRQKHARFAPPVNAMLYCLAEAGVRIEDVDYIAAGWDPGLAPDSIHMREFLNSIVHHEYFRDCRLPEVVPVDHHVAHAYASWIGSGFADAAVLVADGRGETKSTSIYRARGDSLELTGSFGVRDSLGYFYGSVTRHLGFGRGSEGKAMGLAAYGRPLFDFPIRLDQDGYRIDLEVPEVPWDQYGKELTRAWADWLGREIGSGPGVRMGYSALRGRAGSSLGDEVLKYADVAASAQAALERTMAHLSRLALSRAGSRNLVLGGGVALNCSCNGKLAALPEVDQMYVFPGAGDSGSAVGAAFKVSMDAGSPRPGPVTHAYFGPSFSSEQIGQALSATGVTARRLADPAETAAELVLAGKTLGWFQGAAEFGPRALGHRSIIADPHDAAALERVNRIKGRELWRPLAPSALPETAARMLGTDKGSRFMLRAFEVREQMRDVVPAVVHVDATTRAQVVDAATNPEYAALLAHVGEATGDAVVLNTSFNDESEPIVQTPRDALRTFHSTGLDALVMGDWVVLKH